MAILGRFAWTLSITVVYTVDASSHTSMRQVRLGDRFGDETEILGGLRAGDRIALDPLAAAKSVELAASTRWAWRHEPRALDPTEAGAAMSAALGLSGRIARQFLTSQLTPLLALTALLAGVFAASSPRRWKRS